MMIASVVDPRPVLGVILTPFIELLHSFNSINNRKGDIFKQGTGRYPYSLRCRIMNCLCHRFQVQYILHIALLTADTVPTATSIDMFMTTIY